MVVEKDERVQLESLDQLVCVLRVVTCVKAEVVSKRRSWLTLRHFWERSAHRGASCPARRRLVLD